MVQSVYISLSEWEDAKKWNKTHTISEGRYVCALDSTKKHASMLYVPPEGDLLPGWTKIKKLPRKLGKTLSYTDKSGKRVIYRLKWL